MLYNYRDFKFDEFLRKILNWRNRFCDSYYFLKVFYQIKVIELDFFVFINV